jgi:hypothetical protein
MRRLFLATIATLLPAVAMAQTEGAQAIARDVFSDRPVPGVPARVIPESPPRTVVQERVVTERVVPARTVVERPVVRERVVVSEAPARWWDVFARNRYGYYDDAYFDDNWFYDYYELPRIQRGAATPGFRTGWTYDPVAERGIFSF